ARIHALHSFPTRRSSDLLGGIFLAQVVEHLPPPQLVRLLELAHAKLRSDGVLVAETINPLSPIALRNYFADLTHAQPLVAETLRSEEHTSELQSLAYLVC